MEGLAGLIDLYSLANWCAQATVHGPQCTGYSAKALVFRLRLVLATETAT